MKRALLIIDVQNDYFPGGNYPLWNADATLVNIIGAIKSAQTAGVEIIKIQHVANPEKGISPFFNQGTTGVEIHPQVLEVLPDGPVVVKSFADSFLNTDLEQILTRLAVTELLVCGMMTQNCVTHTAISKSAEKYAVTILADCCTTVDEMIHLIALNAVSPRVSVKEFREAISEP